MWFLFPSLIILQRLLFGFNQDTKSFPEAYVTIGAHLTLSFPQELAWHGHVRPTRAPLCHRLCGREDHQLSGISDATNPEMVTYDDLSAFMGGKGKGHGIFLK